MEENHVEGEEGLMVSTKDIRLSPVVGQDMSQMGRTIEHHFELSDSGGDRPG